MVTSRDKLQLKMVKHVKVALFFHDNIRDKICISMKTSPVELLHINCRLFTMIKICTGM